MPRPKSLSLELLETFLRLVANEGDAATTARELNINQPSMSKRLRYFQHAGGLIEHPWLDRVGKTWQLTEEGGRVRAAVEEMVRLAGNLKSFANPERGRPELRFACGHTEVNTFVRQAVRRFREKHPGVHLRISTLRGVARIDGVANGLLDLAIVNHSKDAIAARARRKLYIEPIDAGPSEGLALVCAKETPWTRELEKLPRDHLPLDVLTRFPLVMPEPDAGVRQTLDAVLREKGLLRDLEIVVEIGGWSAILAYVRDGLGVALVSGAALVDSKDLVVRYLNPRLLRLPKNKMICRSIDGQGKRPDLSPSAAAFLDAVRGFSGSQH